jgi:hypothetical protein
MQCLAVKRGKWTLVDCVQQLLCTQEHSFGLKPFLLRN